MYVKNLKISNINSFTDNIYNCQMLEISKTYMFYNDYAIKYIAN